MPHKDHARRLEYERQRYARNRDKINERRRVDYHTATVPRWRGREEERRLQERTRYHADPERARERRKHYYHAKPDLHREAARKAHRAVMERDPESFRARVRQRWAREKGAEGVCTADDWRAILDHYEHCCLCCGHTEKERVLTQDHVIPLSLGGTHWSENLQPLCKSCNSSKGGRTTTDYRPDKGDAFRRHQETGT